MSVLASTLPSNDGYVAAAYVVFFVLVLVYVAVMAVRLSRVERRLRELQEGRDGERNAAESRGAAPREAPASPGGPREEELV